MTLSGGRRLSTERRLLYGVDHGLGALLDELVEALGEPSEALPGILIADDALVGEL